jgi:patatin-like phospholipase/acyl hydrolase
VAKRKKRRKKNPSMGAVVGFIGGTVVGGITSVALTMLANPQSKTAQSAH